MEQQVTIVLAKIDERKVEIFSMDQNCGLSDIE